MIDGCAWCVVIAARPANRARPDTPAPRAYAPPFATARDALAAARHSQPVVIDGGTRLPMLADTIVRGTLVCWLHAADAIEQL